MTTTTGKKGVVESLAIAWHGMLVASLYLYIYISLSTHNIYCKHVFYFSWYWHGCVFFRITTAVVTARCSIEGIFKSTAAAELTTTAVNSYKKILSCYNKTILDYYTIVMVSATSVWGSSWSVVGLVKMMWTAALNFFRWHLFDFIANWRRFFIVCYSPFSSSPPLHFDLL